MADSSKASESQAGASETWTNLPPPPPPYGAAPVGSNPAKLNPPFALHRAFSPVMAAYAIYEFSVAMLKTFKICCGNDKNDVVFTVEVHPGIVPRSPLGTRLGPILHRGVNRKQKGTVLAAGGVESTSSGQYLAFNPRSTIILPPLYHGPDATPHDMATEIMRAVRLEGGGVTHSRERE